MAEGEEKPASRVGSALAAAGTVGTRMWDFVARLATLTSEQQRHSAQLEKLSDQLLILAKDVQRMAGKLEGIEKRLDDRDKMIEMTVALRIKEELDKRQDGKPKAEAWRV